MPYLGYLYIYIVHPKLLYHTKPSLAYLGTLLCHLLSQITGVGIVVVGIMAVGIMGVGIVAVGTMAVGIMK